VTSTRPVRERDLSRPLPAALSWSVLVGFVAAFAIAYVVLALPWWMPALIGVMSVIAFAAYGIDKAAARRGAQRVSEQTLLALGFLGGWPGAIVAQQLFRHKTRKRAFRRRFWASVVLSLLTLAVIIGLAVTQGWSLALPWPPPIG